MDLALTLKLPYFLQWSQLQGFQVLLFLIDTSLHEPYKDCFAVACNIEDI